MSALGRKQTLPLNGWNGRKTDLDLGAAERFTLPVNITPRPEVLEMALRIAALITVLLANASCTVSPGASVRTQIAAPAATTGSLRGSPYRIDVPANWNGDLIVYFHGYELPGSERRHPWPKDPLTDIFLSRGFAVAQSAYPEQGWAVTKARVESDALRRHFQIVHRKPRRTYAVGESFGGHLVISSLERLPSSYDGGLSLCGANVPARIMVTNSVDQLAVAEVLFPRMIPLGTHGLADPALPPMLERSALEGIAGRLRESPDKASLLARLIGIEAADVPVSLWVSYAFLREFIDRAGGFPVDNRATDYEKMLGAVDGLNSKVRRYSADPRASRYLEDHGGLTGGIDDPLVVLSNQYDDLMPVRLHAFYRRLVKAAGREHNLIELPPQGHGHCKFTHDQIRSALDRLVVAGGDSPPGS